MRGRADGWVVRRGLTAMKQSERRRMEETGGTSDRIQFLEMRIVLLEGEMKRLMRENHEAVERHNSLLPMIEAMRNSGRILQPVDNLPPDVGIVVPITVVQETETRMRAAIRDQRDFMDKGGDWQTLVVQIDTLAFHCNRGDLAKHLNNGTVKELGGLMVALESLTRQMGMADAVGIEAMRNHTRERIRGIEAIPKDNGDSLLEIVSRLSWSVRADSIAAKMAARQGRQIEPITMRLYEYAHRFKYKENRQWRDAALALLNDLETRTPLDPTDAAILADVQARPINEYVSYLKRTYNRVKNTKKARV